MAKFQELYEFVDSAVKNRKYAPNTAFGLKAALKIFEAEINDEERNSIAKFEEHFEQVFRGVSLKNKTMTAGSLLNYKSRMRRLLEHYKNYGSDPVKMNSWTIKPPTARPKKEQATVSKSSPPVERKEDSFEISNNFVFDFKGGIKLIIPRTTDTSDAIADGELKSARQALSKFAEDFMKDSPAPNTEDEQA